jgi:hypothetical protein
MSFSQSKDERLLAFYENVRGSKSISGLVAAIALLVTA